MAPGTLAAFPYVVVRIGCSKCSRKGQYRLARLAAKLGPDARMTDVLAALAGNCALWGVHTPGIERCGALFHDIANGRPPDTPRDAQPIPKRPLRVVR